MPVAHVTKNVNQQPSNMQPAALLQVSLEPTPKLWRDIKKFEDRIGEK